MRPSQQYSHIISLSERTVPVSVESELEMAFEIPLGLLAEEYYVH